MMIILVPLVIAGVSQAQVPATPEHGAIMERKLESTKKVLEGIAREDFAEIAKQAQVLTLLSHEAGWNVLQTPDYIRLSEDFRSTAGQMKKSAEDGNLDAVGLAYIKLSISCIDCHRYAKQERVGRRPVSGSGTQVR